MKKTIAIIILAGALALTFLWIMAGGAKQTVVLGGGFGDKGTTASTTAYTVTSASQQVLQARGNRAFTLFSNNSANDIYLRFESAPAVLNTGFLLRASTTFSVTENSPYRGEVRAIAAANSSLLITEGVYNN